MPSTMYAKEFSKILSGYPVPHETNTQQGSAGYSSQSLPRTPSGPPQRHVGAMPPTTFSSRSYGTNYPLKFEPATETLPPSFSGVLHVRTPEAPIYSLRLATWDEPQRDPTPSGSWQWLGPVHFSSPRKLEEDDNPWMGDGPQDVRQVLEVRVEKRETSSPLQEPSSREGTRAVMPRPKTRTSLLAQLIGCDPVIEIRDMILSSPLQKLKLREIRELLETRYPQLRGRRDWEGKVRHHLSVQREFRGDLGYWFVDENQTGNRPRRPQWKKKTAAPLTAINPHLVQPRIQRRYGPSLRPDNARVQLTRAPVKKPNSYAPFPKRNAHTEQKRDETSGLHLRFSTGDSKGKSKAG